MRSATVFAVAAAAAATGILSAAPLAAADECSTIINTFASFNGSLFYMNPPSNVLNCFKTFSITADYRQAQVNALKSYFQLYPFLDEAKDSSSPYYASKYDLFAALDAAAADTTLTSEFAFQWALIDAVNLKLNDGHATYLPYCFTLRFYAMLPFVFGAQYSGSATPQIVIRDAFTRGSGYFAQLGTAGARFGAVLDNGWWAAGLGGKLPADFAGYVVQSINGVDAVTFVKSYADSEGQSRSADTRFNNALVSYQYLNGQLIPRDGNLYLRTNILRADMPDALALVLSNPTTGETVSVSAKWAVWPTDTSGFANNAKYYSQYCPRSALASSSSASASSAKAANLDLSVDDIAAAAEPAAVPVAGAVAKGLVQPLPAGTILNLSEILPESLRPVLPKSTLALEKAVKEASSGTTGVVPVEEEVLDRIASKSAAAAALATDEGLQRRGSLRRRAISIKAPLVSDNNGAFYQLDATTGVWMLPTFFATNNNGDAWMATIATGLSALERANVTQLLIDVSGNGGGLICQALAIAQFLFPKQPISAVTYDVRASQVLQDIVRMERSAGTGGTLDVTILQNATSFQQLTTADQLLVPGVTSTRGGVTGRYSNRFRYCDSSASYMLNASKFNQLKAGWPASKVALISDGNCASSCAVFTRTLRANYGVRAYVVGGASGQSFAPTSYDGGLRVTFADLLTETNNAVAGTKVAAVSPRSSLPSAFPLSGQGSIPLWEAYSPNASLDESARPLDFTIDPADALLSEVGNALNPLAVWNAVATRLAANA
ncbi:hypothetical protein DFJ73DRAFT_763906 [Zopfochytrium polystomum]|nr:hypothetical protein DFJ73DRAFT_763906 [Zopfochytrium polystomum]